MDILQAIMAEKGYSCKPQKAPYEFTADPDTHVLRQLNPVSLCVGDHNATKIRINIPQRLDHGKIDVLNASKITIDYRIGDYSDQYQVTDLALDNAAGCIILGWLISNAATRQAGDLTFALVIRNLNEDSEVTAQWSSAPAALKVSDTIDTDAQIYEPVVDAVESLKRTSIYAPYIDAVTGHWMIYDYDLNAYQDSNVSAYGSPGKSPKIENGTWYIYNSATGLYEDTGINATGPQGIQGETGDPGKDGVSPAVTTTTITGGHRVTVTDASGDHSFDVMDGATGPKGDTGSTGDPGKDGISPAVTTTPITGGHQVTITDVSGDHTFDVMDGATGATGPKGDTGSTGDPGRDGISPEVTTTTITGGHQITITDATGNHTFDVMDGITGATGATGPQGPKGDPGDDYVLTAADRQAIAAIVLDEIDATNTPY